MDSYDPTIGDVSSRAEAGIRRHGSGVEKLARIGYAARGAVYILIGALAFKAAFGLGGETTDIPGALNRLAEKPFGSILLLLVGIGFVGYALWRFVQAAMDVDHDGRDRKGIVKRIGYAVSGIVYAGFALSAFKVMQGSQASESGTQDWTARLMEKPFGVWLVGIAGLIWIGVAVAQAVQAYKASFCKRLKVGEMSGKERLWTERAGRIGYAARSLVFAAVGVFLVKAAVDANPGEARGLSGAMEAFAAWEGGPWILGLIAIGLVAFGIYSLVEARFRRIDVASSHGSPGLSRR